MTDIYSVFFSFQKPEEIQQIDRLNPIIQQIVSCGYYLVAEEEQQDTDSKLSNWIIQLHHQSEQDQASAIPFQPGISDQARQHVEQFCQEQTEQCDLIGFWAADSGLGRGFDFRLTLYSKDLLPGTLGLSFDQDFFVNTDREAHYSNWLETLEAIYSSANFLYAYQLDHSGLYQPTLREDLLAQGVTRLYLLNIFSPMLVAQLGRERLLSAPAGLVAPLTDGGILLLPYVFTSTLPNGHPYAKPEEVASYLGLAFPEQ